MYRVTLRIIVREKIARQKTRFLPCSRRTRRYAVQYAFLSDTADIQDFEISVYAMPGGS
jgi:hypothetical protein